MDVFNGYQLTRRHADVFGEAAVEVDDPFAAGTPVIAPAGDSDNPCGSAPEITLHTKPVFTPPDAASAWL